MPAVESLWPQLAETPRSGSGVQASLRAQVLGPNRAPERAGPVTRPPIAVVLSVALGAAIVWLSLATAYFTDHPIGFFVTSVGFAIYLLGRGCRGRGSPC